MSHLKLMGETTTFRHSSFNQDFSRKRLLLLLKLKILTNRHKLDCFTHWRWGFARNVNFCKIKLWTFIRPWELYMSVHAAFTAFKVSEEQLKYYLMEMWNWRCCMLSHAPLPEIKNAITDKHAHWLSCLRKYMNYSTRWQYKYQTWCKRAKRSSTTVVLC